MCLDRNIQVYCEKKSSEREDLKVGGQPRFYLRRALDARVAADSHTGWTSGRHNPCVSSSLEHDFGKKRKCDLLILPSFAETFAQLTYIRTLDRYGYVVYLSMSFLTNIQA